MSYSASDHFLPGLADKSFAIRQYQPSDRKPVRAIFGDDEFARPRLLQRYPRMSEYLADESSAYYTDCEPQSVFIAEVSGDVVGALLGAVNTPDYERTFKRRIQPLLIRRCLSGAYGIPLWLRPVILTEIANRKLETPIVDLTRYPAHLHIGILPGWRRQGIGSCLMTAFAEYLQARGIPGYHLYASSFHPLGVAFYRKLGLENLGQFAWRFHDGFHWLAVTEYIFGMDLAHSFGNSL